MASEARVELGNLRTGDIFSAQFNPEHLQRLVDVNYTRQGVQGLSHEILQYQFRQNEKLDFTLYFDARSTDQGDQKTAERLLDGLTLSSRDARDIAGGGPPDALFLWPELLALRCRVTQLKYTYKKFAPTGARIHFMVDVKVEEARDTRLYAEDVLKTGLFRF